MQATGGQEGSPCSAAASWTTRAGGRGKRFRRLCTPQAPARVTQTRSWPGRPRRQHCPLFSCRAPRACAAGLMHSTQTRGAGIAAMILGLSPPTHERETLFKKIAVMTDASLATRAKSRATLLNSVCEKMLFEARHRSRSAPAFCGGPYRKIAASGTKVDPKSFLGPGKKGERGKL